MPREALGHGGHDARPGQPRDERVPQGVEVHHAALFGFLADVMYASLEPGEEPDAGAVAAALRKAGLLEHVGGLECLTMLADSFGTAASVPLHIKTLKALTLRRVALAEAHEVARTAGNRPETGLP